MCGKISKLCLRFGWISLAIFSVLMIQTLSSPVAYAQQRYAFSTSPLGGTWYSQAAGLAELWNKNIPGMVFTVEGTGGSIIAPKQLSEKKVDVALTVLDFVNFARTGNRPYEKKYDLSDVRSVILMGVAPTHFIVKKDSPIKGVKDLKGKRVSIGDRGASANVRIMWFLEVAGLTKDDIKPEYLGHDQASDALNDGRTDCWAEAYSVPAGVLLSLSQTSPIRLLKLTDEEAKKLMDKYPFMNPFLIPAGTYGKGQNEDVIGYGVLSCLMVRKEIPEDVVYKMCKSINDNWEFLYSVHKDFQLWKFSGDIEKTSGQPLHPGALKFYKEKGLIK